MDCTIDAKLHTNSHLTDDIASQEVMSDAATETTDITADTMGIKSPSKNPMYVLPGSLSSRRRFALLPWRKMSSRSSNTKVKIRRRTSQIISSTSQNVQTDISIPGMNNIFAYNFSLWRRLIWAVAIVACTIACLVLISFRISEFLKIPVSVQVEVVTESVISFPAVTICPFYPFSFNRKINALRDKYARNYNVNHAYITYWNDSNSIHFLDLLELPEVNITRLWRMGGVKEKNMEINRACQFQTKKNCHVPIKVEEIVTYLGICATLTFKANELYFDGSYNGMELKLFEHGSDSSYWQHMLLLHDPGEDPKHFLYLKPGQPLHPKREITILFFIKKYRRVNIRNRPCKQPAEFELCRKECVEYHLTKNVTCRLPYMASENLPLCNSPATAKQTYTTTLAVYSAVDELCSRCQRKCAEVYYNMIQDVVMTKNCSWPKILMQDNTVEVVQETTPITFGVLLSEIGGSLGLFLGACLLTVLQVMEAFATKIIDKFKNG